MDETLFIWCFAEEQKLKQVDRYRYIYIYSYLLNSTVLFATWCFLTFSKHIARFNKGDLLHGSLLEVAMDFLFNLPCVVWRKDDGFLVGNISSQQTCTLWFDTFKGSFCTHETMQDEQHGVCHLGLRGREEPNTKMFVKITSEATRTSNKMPKKQYK